MILWLVDKRLEKQEPRWVMLIGGDESPMLETDRTINDEDRPWWQRGGRRGLPIIWQVVLYGTFALLATWLTRWIRKNVLP